VLLTIGGLKGGIGKTTSAGFLAAALSRTGRTLAIDADPQSQSLFDWAQVAAERGISLPWDCQPWATPDVARKVRMVRDQYDHIVIDTGGETSRLFREAVSVAPELVIPVRPNLIELRRIPATFEAAAEVESVTGTAVYPRVLLVGVDTRAGDAPAARDFLTTGATGPDGQPAPIPTMQAQVRQSVLYPRSFGTEVDDLGDYADVLAELLAGVAA
jgi:cellulose biosynthesis protein BcsQ